MGDHHNICSVVLYLIVVCNFLKMRAVGDQFLLVCSNIYHKPEILLLFQLGTPLTLNYCNYSASISDSHLGAANHLL
jgi:hypothetical protein